MSNARHQLVMAVFPTTRGFSSVVFEGPFAPVDWATVERRGKGKNKQCIVKIERLLDRYRPDILVLQDMSTQGTCRGARVRRLNDMIFAAAGEREIPVAAYSRDQVRAAFAGDGQVTKQRIAAAIARDIPMFAPLVPPPRKPWNTEHPRMGIFDAAALVLTFFREQLTGAETVS